jgi:hypothetical protein
MLGAPSRQACCVCTPRVVLSRQVSKPPGLPLPALDSPFVRPKDAPDDIPDWALKPAIDLPFFADEPVNDRPTGTGMRRTMSTPDHEYSEYPP